MDCIYIALSYT